MKSQAIALLRLAGLTVMPLSSRKCNRTWCVTSVGFYSYPNQPPATSPLRDESVPTTDRPAKPESGT
jgi:hypothetical protein